MKSRYEIIKSHMGYKIMILEYKVMRPVLYMYFLVGVKKCFLVV